MTAFDQIAPQYAALWSESEGGRRQREIVWREIDARFHAGDHVLDLGCGIGDDALHLASRGVEVTGLDGSEKMVEIARVRGVRAHVGLAENPIEECYAGVLSNFGVLNCVADLDAVAGNLGQAVVPGGYAALCVMGRFLWREPRRWSGRTVWRGMDVYYRGAFEMRRAFAPWFRLEKRVSIERGDHVLYVFRRAG